MNRTVTANNAMRCIMVYSKFIGKLILISIFAMFACISFVVFVGCSNNDYEISNVYVVFEDGIGNEYKIEGKERKPNSTSVRVFSRTIYYDYDPYAVYSFMANAYLKDDDQKLDLSDIEWEASFSHYTGDTYSVDDYYGLGHLDGTYLYGNKPGTYYANVYISYGWYYEDIVVRVFDRYYIEVHINGDIKDTNINAVFEDDIGNSYTVEGSKRLVGDDSIRVFTKTITYNSAPDATYTFTGGLYYPDSKEKVEAGLDAQLAGNGFYNGLERLTQINRYGYNDILEGHITGISEVGGSTINGANPRTYYFLLGAEYYYGTKYEDFDGVRLLRDYYVLIVEIK